MKILTADDFDIVSLIRCASTHETVYGKGRPELLVVSPDVHADLMSSPEALNWFSPIQDTNYTDIGAASGKLCGMEVYRMITGMRGIMVVGNHGFVRETVFGVLRDKDAVVDVIATAKPDATGDWKQEVFQLFGSLYSERDEM